MSTAATKRRVGVISTVVVALIASLLVWMASRSEGEIVRKADLNDGGIWVTNAEQARFGRINKPAGQLDAGVLSDGSTGSGLDVFQDGAAIVGYSKASNQIVPINPAEGTLAPEQSIVVPKPSTATGNRVFTAPLVDVRGETIAMIDPAKGEVRAQHVDNRSGIAGLDGLQTQAKPLAKVGGNAAVAVGVDGTVYAVSAELGTITVLRTRSPHRSRRSSASRPSRHRSRPSARTGSSGTPAPASSTPMPSRSPSSSRSETPSPATRPSPRCSSPAPTRGRSSSRTRPS
jgi:hypothetical protein